MSNKSRCPKTKNQRFCIDAANDVSLVTSELPNPTDSTSFSSERELSVRVASWPSSRLVEIWSRLPTVNPVRRFTDRRTAVRRIWGAIQEGHVNQIPGADAQGNALPKALGSGTKTAQIIELLKQPAGATLKLIMELTGWQSHSVRGFLSAQLSKKRSLRIESFTRSGQRVYRIRDGK